MKKSLSFLFILFFVTLIYSQKKFENPQTGFTTASFLTIKKVEITDSTTVVSFEISNSAGMQFSVPKKSYIKDVASGEKLFIKSSEGASMEKMNVVPESGIINYKFVFGKLDKSVTKIDYGVDGGTWSIYDIELQNSPNTLEINPELAGNWYNTENGNWEIG
ncbi:MAG: hypothetical protein ABI554_12235, partial [Flavobacterium sp.]